MTLAIISPSDGTALEGYAPIAVTAVDNLSDGTAVVWSSIDQNMQFSLDGVVWTPTLDTNIVAQRATCKMRCISSTRVYNVPVTVMEQGDQNNTATNHYDFKILVISSPPNNSIQPADSVITIVAGDGAYQQGAIVTWQSDDTSNVQFSKDRNIWRPTVDTNVTTTGTTSCYMRWNNLNAQNVVNVTAFDKANPGNTATNSYDFRVINVSGVGNHAFYADNPEDGVLNHGNPNTRINITTRVTDLFGNPIPNWEIVYSLLGQNRPEMWAASVNQPTPTQPVGSNKSYSFLTQSNGLVEACIGSALPTIVMVEATTEGFGASEATLVLAKPEPDRTSYLGSPLINEVTDPALDLDDIGLMFHAYLQADVTSNVQGGGARPTDNDLAAFVLNNRVLKTGKISSLKNLTPLSTASLIADGTTPNQLHFMVQTTSDFAQSMPYFFHVTGEQIKHPDYDQMRILDAPSIPTVEVNFDAIMNDFSIAFAGYGSNPFPGLGGLTDVITVNLYMNAYANTHNDIAKSGTYTITYYPRQDEWVNGFTVPVPRTELLGYSQGETKRGQIEIEYIVDNPAYIGNATRYSHILGYPRWVTLDT